MTAVHVLRTRGDRLSLRWSTRGTLVLVAALALGVAAGGVAIYTGNRDVAPGLVTAILAGDYSGASAFDVFTVLDNRLPRAICALLAGALFGVSGAIFQRLTENALGSPDLIGFSSGASAGALVAIAVGGGVGIAAGALVGALVAVAAVYLLAWRGGIEGYRLLLVGIAVGAVLAAVSSYLLSRIELADAAAGYRWLVGALDGRSWSDAGLGAAGLLLVAPFVIALHRGLDRLASGADLAASQGLSVGRTRAGAALVGTACVAVGVCVAGPIGFVALAAPHIARFATARPGPLLATSAVVGAALLAVSDVLAGRLFPPHQLPTGVVTAVLGGVYLVWLLQHRSRERRHA